MKNIKLHSFFVDKSKTNRFLGFYSFPSFMEEMFATEGFQQNSTPKILYAIFFSPLDITCCNIKVIQKHCTKNEFSIKDFYSKYEQIHRKLRIWSYLLEKSLMENFIFCAVKFPSISSSYSCVGYFHIILYFDYFSL